MRRLLTTALMLCPALSAGAATYTVNPAGTGDFPTIQAAIDSVLGGDVILLTDGTFTGTGNRNIDFRGKEVTVRSESGDPYACVIDCQQLGRGFRFASGEGPGARLEGVTITNGRPSPYGDGGAILCMGGARPVIRHCRIMDSRAESGAGMWIDHASPEIDECLLSGNTATSTGGGGMNLTYSTARIHDCYFLQNSVPGCGGGARCCLGTAGVVFESCWFALNVAHCYGGGAIAHTGVSFVDCVFRYNESSDCGGGLRLNEGDNLVSGCTFYANSSWLLGGGISTSGSLQIENTIVSHSLRGGGLIASTSDLQVSCCDIYSNAGGDWVGPIAGLLGVQGNICEDPLYCDPEAGDLHLDALSPCAPSNPECGLIGALGVACGQTPIDQVSWGEIKAMFRPGGGAR